MALHPPLARNTRGSGIDWALRSSVGEGSIADLRSALHATSMLGASAADAATGVTATATARESRLAPTFMEAESWRDDR